MPGKEDSIEVDVERGGDVSDMINLEPLAERGESSNANNGGYSAREEQRSTVRGRGEGLEKVELPPNYVRFSV